MFNDFEERFGPKTIVDIVFPSQNSRQLLEELIIGQRPFPITEGKCAILLYGIPGTGKSALAKMLPDAIEQARGGSYADETYVRVEPGQNGLSMVTKIARQAKYVPFGRYHYFVLDEVDRLSTDAMAILKSVMNYRDTVWVLTTNNFPLIEVGVKDRSHCVPFNAAPSTAWLPLARRILSHAGVEGVSDAQIISVIAPCNGSAREITDAIVSLVLALKRSGATSQTTSASVVA